MLNPLSEKAGPIATDTNRKGDFFELHVIREAWRRGAEVYSNAGCTGAVDLILQQGEQQLKCDVKSMRYQNKCWKSTGASVADGVHVIHVNPLTEEIRWTRGKEPEGWESFWD
tara:strand:- start:798 stop:1136 length:339 start_codon:yes stop_codon:yes gene_type:complete